MSTLQTANLDNIPAELREQNQFVVWRYEQKENGDTTKVPYDAKTGYPASTTNPADWCDFETAVSAFLQGGNEGIGFVFTEESGYIGVDFDDCLDGTTKSELRGMRPTEYGYLGLLNSYAEVSPSGTGFKVIFKGRIPDDFARRGFGKGNGIYQSGRYFTLTGDVLPPFTTINEVPQARLEAFLCAVFPPQQRSAATWEEAEERLTDAEVLRLATRAANGGKFTALWEGRWKDAGEYDSQSAADMALVALLAFYTGPVPAQIDRLFRASGLFREKWNERRGYDTYGARTIERGLDNVSEYYTLPGASIRSHMLPDGRTEYDAPGARRSSEHLGVDTAASVAAPALPAVGRRLSTVQPERVAWLWPGRIPYGKLTIIDGDPGLGKSTVTMDIAARLSAGRAMPDGTLVEAAGVVLLTAEDGLADTVVPRLVAAGANLKRIIDASTREEGDRLAALSELDWLEANIKDVDARLVIIDPLMAFLPGKVDSHNDQHIRAALGPLAKSAERTGVAVVVVRHLNKGKNTSAIYRGGGSIGIIGAARSGLLVAKDPRDAQRRVLASVKSNLGPPPASLAYRLEGTGDGSSRVVWLGVADYDADALLSGESEKPQGERERAASFLREALANGPVYSTDLFARAEEAGIAERTLWRAMDDLAVVSWKEPGVQRGRNLRGWASQRAAMAAAPIQIFATPLATTVADSEIPDSNQEIYTLPRRGNGRVEPVASIHTVPTLPTLPATVDGQVERGNVVHYPPRKTTPEEQAREAAEETWWQDHVRLDYDAETDTVISTLVA